MSIISGICHISSSSRGRRATQGKICSTLSTDYDTSWTRRRGGGGCPNVLLCRTTWEPPIQDMISTLQPPERQGSHSVTRLPRCIQHISATEKMCRRCDLRSDLCQLMGPVCVYTPSSSSVWSPGEHRPKLWFISGSCILHMYIQRVEVEPLQNFVLIGQAELQTYESYKESPPQKVFLGKSPKYGCVEGIQLPFLS